MERIALFVLILMINCPTSADDSRLNRELDFILGIEKKAPPTPKIVTYEDWKGEKGKLDSDGMIVDETSTALAAPKRKGSEEKIIIQLNKKEEPTPFKTPRRRSR